MRSLNVFLDNIERVISQGMKWPALNAVPAFSFTVRPGNISNGVNRLRVA